MNKIMVPDHGVRVLGKREASTGGPDNYKTISMNTAKMALYTMTQRVDDNKRRMGPESISDLEQVLSFLSEDLLYFWNPPSPFGLSSDKTSQEAIYHQRDDSNETVGNVMSCFAGLNVNTLVTVDSNDQEICVFENDLQFMKSLTVLGVCLNTPHIIDPGDLTSSNIEDITTIVEVVDKARYTIKNPAIDCSWNKNMKKWKSVPQSVYPGQYLEWYIPEFDQNVKGKELLIKSKDVIGQLTFNENFLNGWRNCIPKEFRNEHRYPILVRVYDPKRMDKRVELLMEAFVRGKGEDISSKHSTSRVIYRKKSLTGEETYESKLLELTSTKKKVEDIIDVLDGLKLKFREDKENYMKEKQRFEKSKGEFETNKEKLIMYSGINLEGIEKLRESKVNYRKEKQRFEKNKERLGKKKERHVIRINKLKASRLKVIRGKEKLKRDKEKLKMDKEMFEKYGLKYDKVLIELMSKRKNLLKSRKSYEEANKNDVKMRNELKEEIRSIKKESLSTKKEISQSNKTLREKSERLKSLDEVIKKNDNEILGLIKKRNDIEKEVKELESKRINLLDLARREKKISDIEGSIAATRLKVIEMKNKIKEINIDAAERLFSYNKTTRKSNRREHVIEKREQELRIEREDFLKKSEIVETDYNDRLSILKSSYNGLENIDTLLNDVVEGFNVIINMENDVDGVGIKDALAGVLKDARREFIRLLKNRAKTTPSGKNISIDIVEKIIINFNNKVGKGVAAVMKNITFEINALKKLVESKRNTVTVLKKGIEKVVKNSKIIKTLRDLNERGSFNSFANLMDTTSDWPTTGAGEGIISKKLMTEKLKELIYHSKSRIFAIVRSSANYQEKLLISYDFNSSFA